MSEVNNFVNQVRHEFQSQELTKDSVDKNPIKQVEKWIEEAVNSQILEPNAMVLSTYEDRFCPSSRVVYLRGINERGFRFFTNYKSKKAEQIFQSNGSVSVLFFYPELERQIRIEGYVEKLSEEESDAYFNSRPYESRIGAWASEQSSRIESRQVLLDRIEMFKQKFGENVPRPKHWGGYLLCPGYFEFWQGRHARLHDRIVYEKSSVFNIEPATWDIFRIAP